MTKPTRGGALSWQPRAWLAPLGFGFGYARYARLLQVLIKCVTFAGIARMISQLKRNFQLEKENVFFVPRPRVPIPALSPRPPCVVAFPRKCNVHFFPLLRKAGKKALPEKKFALSWTVYRLFQKSRTHSLSLSLSLFPFSRATTDSPSGLRQIFSMKVSSNVRS